MQGFPTRGEGFIKVPVRQEVVLHLAELSHFGISWSVSDGFFGFQALKVFSKKSKTCPCGG